MDKKSVEYNENIKSSILKVISEDGKLLGELSKKDALKIAEEKEMDLVVFVQTAQPPVAKLCYLDKYLFEKNKKEKLIKKNTKQIELKKIKIGLKIDYNDLNTKMKQAKKFIEEGNMVCFFMKFRRKELVNAQTGLNVLQKSADSLADIAQITKEVSLEKNTASLTLKPIGKKALKTDSDKEK
ncbi:MAG: translation initiation factor IF-3 [Bacteroidota bacterium]